MIIPDTNLLLYVYDSSSRYHRPAAAWWSNCLDGEETVGLAPAVALAFVRLSTSGAVFSDPLSLAEAADAVRGWLARAVVTVVGADGDDLERSLELIEHSGAGGRLATDALIAALGIRWRAVIHTADTDFMRFSGVRWYNPITGRGG